MNLEKYPLDVQLFIKELIKKGILTDETIDEVFINYLYSQRYDKDYIECIKHDRKNSLYTDKLKR